jgi:hypothetical protein
MDSTKRTRFDERVSTAVKGTVAVVVLAILGALIYVGTRPPAAPEGRDLGGVAPVDPTDPAPSSLEPGAAEATLTAREVRAHIGFLASDEMKGRDTPSPELEKAAGYVAGEFRRLGLRTSFQWYEYHLASVPNVIGILEGSDPALKGQAVIVGGHMDHIGMQGREAMNGADDNASGTTAVLELAEAFASMKTRPKRSIVFLTFSGEEKGLKGSEAYVEQPAFPLESCVAMFNFDMVGRSQDGYLFIGGVGTSALFPTMMSEAQKGLDLKIETAPGGLAPSDSANFHKKGMPVLFFFTNVHADYHGPEDIVDKINAEGEVAILRLGFRMIREAADRPERLPFTKLEETALPKDFQERLKERDAPKARKPKLGVKRDEDQAGFVIAQVEAGSAAEAAGIERGDLIVEVAGRAISSYDDLRAAMESVKFGDTVAVLYRRSGTEATVQVRIPHE